MNAKTLILSILLFAAAFAACQDFVSDGKYVEAGDCYRVAGEWNKCVLYYLKAANEAEVKWDGGVGPYQYKSTAMKYYNPEFYTTSGLGSDTGKCLHELGDAEITAKVQAYYDWLQYFLPTRPTEKPFDIKEFIYDMDAAIFPTVPAEPVEVPSAVCGNGVVEAGEDCDGSAPAGYQCVACKLVAMQAPPAAEEEETGADMTLVIVLALGLLLVVGAIVMMGSSVRGRKEHKEEHEHAKPAEHSKGGKAIARMAKRVQKK
ncbi:MAG: hypothetical protein JW834_01260 [Candidatus Diapherotrites archaeon]|nr:hypothetical protein [Candidatus Diapherotrites archaeon]